MAAEYTRPYLYPKQYSAIFTKKRWAACEASTKSGKTVGAIARFIEWGLTGNGRYSPAPGQNYWWVAPVSDQARIAFQRVKLGLTPGSFSSRESPTPSINLITGPILSFRSADNPDSLFGEDVYGLVGDEASRWRPEAWHACRSTLTATRGPAVLIGNVKGRKNWFYEFCRRIEDGIEPNGHFSRITWRDAVEAGVLDLEEIEDAKRNLPEAVFQELYEAVASDDSGNPFGESHILACVGPLSNENPVAFGIDLAKKKDWFVIIGLDNGGRVCRFFRWQGIPWRESIRRVHEVVGEDVPALVDSTGLGDPVLEELQVGHGNFYGFNFSQASKQRLMEGLAVGIQGHEISYPEGPIKTELMRFEYEYTRTGVRYSAPEGYEDDCVCALALAREQLTTVAPGASMMEFYRETADNARRNMALQKSEDEYLPWHRPVPTSDQITNELEGIYNETIKAMLPSRFKNCFRCGQPVDGPTRVSDGELIWHPACIGFGT